MTARHHSTSSPYTMRTLRLLGCLRRVVLLTLLLAGSAVQAAAVVAEEVVLPLGVLSQGHPQDKLSARLREALRLTGAQLADDTVLRSLDRQCKESRCLTELALRHKASILIAATVEKHESARFVRLWLFDARKLQSRDERAVSTDEQLDQLIREMAVRLLEQYRSPTVEDHVPPSAVEPDKPASDSATSDSATSDSATQRPPTQQPPTQQPEAPRAKSYRACAEAWRPASESSAAPPSFSASPSPPSTAPHPARCACTRSGA